MAAYRRVYVSHRLQADCQEPGSAPEPYARRSSMGYLYLLLCKIVMNIKGSESNSSPILSRHQLRAPPYFHTPEVLYLENDLNSKPKSVLT